MDIATVYALLRDLPFYIIGKLPFKYFGQSYYYTFNA